METIKVFDGNTKITLFVNKGNIYYINHNNTVFDIKKYIDLLIVDNPYDFFNNNGSYAVLYKSDKDAVKSKNKLFRIKKVAIVASLLSLLMLNKCTSLDTKIVDITHYLTYNSAQYDADYFRNKIFASTTLTSEEKLYLYNEDFLTDIMPVINSDNYLKQRFDSYFTNISIKPFDEDYVGYDRNLGFYSVDFPNTLFIKDYEKLDEDNRDTVSHEFIHLCQDTSGYNMIIEACAEIISNEYYEGAKISSYSEQVKLVKALMEIIGTYPIWHYNFTGDFSLIEKEVKPYFTDEDYNLFLKCLTFSYESYASNVETFNNFEKILSVLYKNIYGNDMKDNDTINLVLRGDKTLVRNYFNKRMEESYYLDFKNAEYETITLDKAVNDKMVLIFYVKKMPVSFDSAMAILASASQSIQREIDYSSASISITKIRTGNSKQFISAIIDGVKYEDVDVDDLVAKGIINADYFIVDFKYLTADEYINKKYDETAQIFVSHNGDVTINDDYTVYGKVPKKVQLESVFEKNNNTISYTNMVY